MPEERGLYPKMKVGDAAHLPRRAVRAERCVRRTRRRPDGSTRLGLGDRADARLEELSHGNQQRVQLAAALVHDPELAVLDEPFSGLDPLGVGVAGRDARADRRLGVAVVFSSHQLDLVEDVCQDVVIIDHGQDRAGRRGRGAEGRLPTVRSRSA